MKKAIKVIVVLVILAAVGVPLVNMATYVPAKGALSGADPLLSEEVAKIMEEKCLACHSQNAELPFYASLPVVGDLIQMDIKKGIDYVDLANAFAPEKDRILPEVALAKLEFAISQNAMPPLRYKALHWNAGLTAKDVNTLMTWIKETRTKHFATEGVAEEFATEPLQPLPKKVDLNKKKVALGNTLYHDTRLSGDGTVSCASCHDLNKGGTDQLQFSKGIDGQQGGINAPTVYNAAYQIRQFWDGRAADLVEQAGGPVTNPIEMGGNWDDVVKKLSEDEELTAAFKKIYPDGWNNANIQDAIAEFERSLVTVNSRFDQYLYGDKNALNEEELKGYELFKANGCATCHAGKAAGGLSFEIMGREADYFGDRGNVGDADMGRMNFTKNEVDQHRFKVPLLRNITATKPYFHDGSVTDVREAVKKMSEYQNGTQLSDTEIDAIVAFLKSMTGEHDGKPVV